MNSKFEDFNCFDIKARELCPLWMHTEHNAHYRDISRALLWAYELGSRLQNEIEKEKIQMHEAYLNGDYEDLTDKEL